MRRHADVARAAGAETVVSVTDRLLERLRRASRTTESAN
jgi:hypothetical protein